ncbi:unnamed protein product [Effrenium voratum]|uniref:Uncharacterized protein n=1 Tax=Effrenium voratum TaxID=2562239 RepID=A0AA36N7N3_9DINO|nr:unnamed protein product [Effrenium voratum]
MSVWFALAVMWLAFGVKEEGRDEDVAPTSDEYDDLDLQMGLFAALGECSSSDEAEPLPIQPPLQAVDPLDLALNALGVPNLFQECGGDPADFANLQRSYEMLAEHIAAWKRVADLVKCQITCHCSECLRFFMKLTKCRLCLGLGSKNGHSGCGLSQVSSYFRRYHVEKPLALGRYYELLAHGKGEEEEAKRILKAEEARLAAEAKEMVRLEAHKRKHLEEERDIVFQQELVKAIDESKKSIRDKWAAQNPTIPVPSPIGIGSLADVVTSGGALGSGASPRLPRGAASHLAEPGLPHLGHVL